MIVFIAYTYVESPKEKQLKREVTTMKLQYSLMNQKMGQMNSILDGLQDRDDNIYREIFEADPIPNSVREGYYGGVNKFESLENYKNSDLMIASAIQLEKIRKELYIQSKSYDEIWTMLKNKEKMLAALPAIQPIANKDLKRMASGFNYRIDPYYKIRKFHWGMDFSSPRGTDIYVTGNGVVIKAKYARNGYGSHVIVDHGYGYQTLYAHMSKIKVSKGDKVLRGDVLGLVGSTGKSVAPHLHYEVIKDGRKINPVNFFYNDLTPTEYEQMLELANRHNQSLD